MIIQTEEFIQPPLEIGRNLTYGSGCDLRATPLWTDFKNKKRVLIPAIYGVKIGNNVRLGSNVIINSGVKGPTTIGDDVYIWHGSVVGHDCILHDRVCLGVGVFLSGLCEIGEDTFIGVGVNISPRVRIGKNCMIGMGASIKHDTVIPDRQVWISRNEETAEYLRDNQWRPPI